MESTVLERVRKLSKYLIYKGYGNNEKELAEALGYSNSGLSQFLNGKKPLTKGFIKKIEELDENVNKGYILNNEVAMLKSMTSERMDDLISLKEINKKYITSLELELERTKNELNLVKEELKLYKK
ncbi:Uncharacterised protein [Algoriella xinjiangensis]|uniref:helix-turn-helix domain-containing protein n=1 Tax=Algoriella xinjiangensis TaxID=684065 RepID=UPI000F62D59D|nr:helix-turn-helix domain-containing protein [Algoriella xinjiangensis]VDH16887.1 Uncharacterised protein [Algoriella xinjiangensis]